MKPRVVLVAMGDRAVRFDLPPDAPRRSLLASLRQTAGVADVVLTEQLGCVVLEEGVDRARVLADVTAALSTRTVDEAAPARSHDVRVVYDGEDLDAVAGAIGATPADVIRAHSGREYVVSMLGFQPGFAYLRGLDPRLVLPRRDSPRPRVPRGSVGIAAEYTGIYPSTSPGGWHLLGRAVDFAAFGPRGATFGVGDRVRFVPSEPEALSETDGEPATLAPPAGAHLEVTVARGLALLVDGGRPGWMHEGVCPGGPLVASGLARANAAVGNARSACAIELTGVLRVVARHGPLVVAADDGAVHRLGDGDAHEVGTDRGTRVRYLAVEGGFDVPIVLGSRGTLLAASLGGFDGRPLRRGDRLAPGNDRSVETPRALAAARLDAPIAIAPGPDTLAGVSVDRLRSLELRIASASNRVGTRLEGPPLPSLPADMQRPSAPMVLGAIELTPAGLIVLGPDHPTTGGYPVIAVVRAASIESLFARPFGAPVSFSA